MQYKSKIHTIIFLFFCAVILTLSIRGVPGNPSHETMNNLEWRDEGPLELSPERGRFALLYSMIEDKSPFFAVPVARLAVPDLGYHNDQYVSLFAPGLSFLVMPGYIIGKILGASQVGTFAMISVFALINTLLIIRISSMLGFKRMAGYLAALTFLFATPAFAYAVTLYQHHVTTFLLLSSLFLLIRYSGIKPLVAIWALIAMALPLDYPNFVILMPVGIAALLRIFWTEKLTESVKIYFKPLGLLTMVGIVPPLLFFLWFNNLSYGNPLQLSGTVSSIKTIDENGRPADGELVGSLSPIPEETTVSKPKKSVIEFFQPRRLINGLYVHFVSIDRGMLFFTPVILLGIYGLFALGKHSPFVSSICIATIGFTVLLYSMWGDPWGGWAFGSRYLIPVYAVLSLGIAKALSIWTKQYILLTLYFLLLCYSFAINTLGAITSSRNPPSVELDNLSLVSGKIQEKSYDRNINYLQSNKSKSFVFQTVAYKYMPASTYYVSIVMLLVFGSLLPLIVLATEKNNGKKKI